MRAADAVMLFLGPMLVQPMMVALIGRIQHKGGRCPRVDGYILGLPGEGGASSRACFSGGEGGQLVDTVTVEAGEEAVPEMAKGRFKALDDEVPLHRRGSYCEAAVTEVLYEGKRPLGVKSTSL